VTQLALGAAFAAIVALLAYRAGSLTASGAVAAFAVGAGVFGATGWAGAAVLFAFFLPSALLSRFGRARKRALLDVEKPGPRDARQVLANGGVAAICALFYARGGAPLAAAFAGAFAAASADTWGTEIGSLSRRNPVSILTLRAVAPGISGGVTLLGTVATIGGALAVATAAALVKVAPLWPVALAGIAGALLDSILGASFQELRWCPSCASECETALHRCGTPTVARRGFRWVGNDAVNVAATLCGALLAWLMVGR
jgi:uncharacterized protein (TIGR00297 family)